MRASELPNELSARGIWWQVGGFTLVAAVSLVILGEFAGSEVKAYLYFETAVTRLYWAFVIPLAGLFDGVREMFRTAAEIREATRARIMARGHARGRTEGIAEGRTEGIAEGRTEGSKARDSRYAEARRRFGIRDEATGVLLLPFTQEVEDFLNDNQQTDA